MSLLCAKFVILGLAPLVAQEQVNHLFNACQNAQRDVKSLIVEFKLEVRDTTFNRNRTATGRFQLIRTAKGEIYASYELLFDSKTKGGVPEQFTGLLLKDWICWLNYDNKHVNRHRIVDEPVEFLGTFFNPIVLLLDRKKAESKWDVSVSKQDDWYQYIELIPNAKLVARRGWFDPLPERVRVQLVVMKADSAKIPKSMPVQIWIRDENGPEYTFTIKSWTQNPKDPPKVGDLKALLNRPGWTDDNP